MAEQAVLTFQRIRPGVYYALRRGVTLGCVMKDESGWEHSLRPGWKFNTRKDAADDLLEWWERREEAA